MAAAVRRFERRIGALAAAAADSSCADDGGGGNDEGGLDSRAIGRARRPTLEMGPGVVGIDIAECRSESGGIVRSIDATRDARVWIVVPAVDSTQSLTANAGAGGTAIWSARAMSRAVAKRFAGFGSSPLSTMASRADDTPRARRLGGSTFG